MSTPFPVPPSVEEAGGPPADAAAGGAARDAAPVGYGTTRGNRGLVVFLAFVFGLSWLIAAPLHLKLVPMSAVSVQVTGGFMMFTPTVATLVALLVIEKPRRLVRATAVWPLRPWPRLVAYLVIGWVTPFVLLAGSLAVGALVGWPRPDWSMPMVGELLKLPAGQPVPPFMLVSLLAGLVINPVITAPLMFGEEFGWRGYLLPRLLPMGRWPALLLSGLIWGLWHAPLTSLGYNYPEYPGWRAVVLFTICCVLLGVLFGWVRLASGSLWPPVLMHGAFNTGAASWTMILAPSPAPSSLHFGVISVAGWVAAAALIAVLEAAGPLRKVRGWRPERAAELEGDPPTLTVDGNPVATASDTSPHESIQ